MRYKFIVVTFFVFFMQIPEGFAQVGMMLGTNYSNVRHDGLLEKTQGQMSLHLGANIPRGVWGV